MNDNQTEIWNRAAMGAGGTAPREGDSALAALLSVHNIAMNGGVGHACAFFSPEKLFAGIQGFLYFGLPKMAALFERAAQLSEEDAEELDSAYFHLVPSDDVIGDAFLQKFIACPNAFSPSGVSDA